MHKSQKNKPLISIILPVYNSSEYLFQTIDSVINQTYTNWELLIIDDNSFDSSKNILKYFKNYKKFKIFFNKKNRGPDYCRNLGLKNCKGDYISFLDSDDVWVNSKLEKQLNFMKNKKCTFSCTNYIPFNESFKLPEVKPKKIYNFSNFVFDTSIATSTMMIEKSKFPKIKFLKGFGFDDYIYKANLLKFSDCYNLNISLTYYRMQHLSISSNKLRNIKYVWNINKLVFKFNYLKNILSICLISLSSLRKYSIRINHLKKSLSLKEKKILFKLKKKYHEILNKSCKGPKISIIIPSYNSAATVKRAVNSIFTQSYKSWEVIFINDGSTDNTKNIIKKYNSSKLKYFENKQKKGQAFSRNYAIKKATGKYIGFLDADDEWLPNKLEHQINFMKYFKLDFSYTNYYYVISGKSYFRKIPNKLNYRELLFENFIGQSTVIYDRKKFEKFSFSYNYRMDFNFWLTVLQKRKNIYGIQKSYCKIYASPNSESQVKLRNLKLNWLTMRESQKLNIFKSIIFISSNIYRSILKKQLHFIFHKQKIDN